MAAGYTRQDHRGDQSFIHQSERAEVGVTLQLAADAVEDVLIRGFDKAQMDLHTS